MAGNIDAHQELLATLKRRFERNQGRHPALGWADVEARLAAAPARLDVLLAMENTGGEPDVVGVDVQTGEVLFVDCAKQSPSGRRSICYDGEAREARKEHPPASSACEMAAAMGIALLDEAQYRDLQALGNFDTTTSSWLKTPSAIRERGGAIFGDRRYDHVFIYHNGAESYYGARGFRGLLRV
jgi:hypothetical protein